MRRIQYILVLFLLFHTACNGCKQYELEHEEDRWGADIAIDTSAGVALQGSINGFPVLSLQGQISKNVPGVDTAVLCALFVPAGSEPDTCAADIADHVVKSDDQSTSSSAWEMGKLHKLSGGSFVYYERALELEETGSVDFSVASLDPDYSLSPGQTYNIYLGVKMGPHFFYTSSAYADYTLPASAGLTEIAMASAHCTHNRDASGSVTIQVTAQANATNPPTAGGVKQGFLFLKQGKELTPMNVLAKQLEADSTSFPDTPNTFAAHSSSDVVICPCAATMLPIMASASAMEIKDVDTHDVLERGATYDVYGYVEDGNDYYFSSNSYPITLPSVEVELTMERVGDPSLVGTRGSKDGVDVHEFRLEVRGRIDKIDNAKDPMAGFVFVASDQSTEKDAILSTITGTINERHKAGDVIQVGGSEDYVVGVAATLDPPHGIGTIQDTFNLRDASSSASYLDLKRDYRVYFWVCDAGGRGELFLSDTGQALRWLDVGNSAVTMPAANHFFVGNDLILRPEVSGTESARNAANADMAFAFLGSHETLNKDNLSAYRRFLNGLDTEAADRGSVRSFSGEWHHTECYGSLKFRNWTTSISAENGTHLIAGKAYQLGLVVRLRNMIYGVHSTDDYTTPAYVPHTTAEPILGITHAGVAYRIKLDIPNQAAYYYNAAKAAYFPMDPSKGKGKNKELIRKAIQTYYGEESQRARAYGDFKVNDE